MSLDPPASVARKALQAMLCTTMVAMQIREHAALLHGDALTAQGVIRVIIVVLPCHSKSHPHG